MEPSTFLEYFLNLRVETHTTWFRTLYRIDISDLPADKANLLRQACEEITARRIRRYGRWLKFEVADLSKSRTWLKFIPKNIEEAELSKSRDGTHS